MDSVWKLERVVKIWKLKRKKTHVASELFFSYVELWAEITNPKHRHTPFATSKIKFSETLCKTKNLHES